MSGRGENVVSFPLRPDARGRALPPWQRDPRRFPFGLLLVDPWPVGTLAGGFSWFESEAAAAEFLRNGLWEILTDEVMAAFPGVRETYQMALAQRSDIAHDWVDAVSALQDHVLVMWFGTFDAFQRGEGAMAQAVMEDYRQSKRLPNGQQLDLQDLMEFLRQYLR